MSRIVIATDLCKGCELCMDVCPEHCFEHSAALNDYGVYPMQLCADAKCIGCSQCAVMCPDAAIEVYRTAAQKTPRNQEATS